jgi:hypothetical protein
MWRQGVALHAPRCGGHVNNHSGSSAGGGMSAGGRQQKNRASAQGWAPTGAAGVNEKGKRSCTSANIPVGRRLRCGQAPAGSACHALFLWGALNSAEKDAVLLTSPQFRGNIARGCQPRRSHSTFDFGPVP